MRIDLATGMLGRVGLRCAIVDDNASFLAAARTILDRGELSVVGEAANAADALRRVDQLAPDVILLDIDLGGESGLEVAREVARQAGAGAPHIVLISAYSEDDFADLVAEGPAIGFVAKSELSAAAILALVRGGGAGGDGEAQQESR